MTKTNISVSIIANMFKVTRASIYNLRDRFKLDTRRGSPALMAGVHRLHAKRSAPVAIPVETPELVAV